jgi:hypothetical protein
LPRFLFPPSRTSGGKARVTYYGFNDPAAPEYEKSRVVFTEASLDGLAQAAEEKVVATGNFLEMHVQRTLGRIKARPEFYHKGSPPLAFGNGDTDEITYDVAEPATPMPHVDQGSDDVEGQQLRLS